MKGAISRIVACAPAAGTLTVLGACNITDEITCSDGSSNLQIEACTRMVSSGRYAGHDLAAAYNNRAGAYGAAGELDRAIADYNQAILLDSKYEHAYFNRGVAYLYFGSFPKALADFDQSRTLNAKDAYAALWADIATVRSNQPSRLAVATAQLDMSRWPAPIVRLYLGQITPDAMFATAADDQDAKTKRGHVCEVNFYSGELALQHGAEDDALRLFRLAANDCPKDFTESHAANAELKALGAAP
jgi:lipoprotein NlpI